jgi:prepilin peptidase CpaA
LGLLHAPAFNPKFTLTVEHALSIDQPKGHGIMELPSIPVFLFVALMACAASIDVRTFRIPNWLTLLVAVLFFPVAIASGMGWQDIGMHVIAGVILFFVGFMFFSFGFFGGGDAKLIAAAALWFGTTGTGFFLYGSVVAGGILAGAMVLWSMSKYVVQLDLGDLIPMIRKVKPQMPYGLALAAGAITAIPQSEWLMATMQ